MKIAHFILSLFSLFRPCTLCQVSKGDACSASLEKLGTHLYSRVGLMHKDVENVKKEVLLVDRSVQIVEAKLSVVKDKVDAGFAAVTNNGKTVEGELTDLKNTIKTGLEAVGKNVGADFAVIKKNLEALQKSVGNMEVGF